MDDKIWLLAFLFLPKGRFQLLSQMFRNLSNMQLKNSADKCCTQFTILDCQLLKKLNGICLLNPIRLFALNTQFVEIDSSLKNQINLGEFYLNYFQSCTKWYLSPDHLVVITDNILHFDKNKTRRIQETIHQKVLFSSDRKLKYPQNT